ncbi:MAG: dTDP-4-amino-4,6-dideoxy-D-galactose acyltransferase [Patescibacteria group bacterium]|nr:dTDP-4-amino-4,6-dideoxy-D-galactose acyltransferase [Patescibacteria group bacterium]
MNMKLLLDSFDTKELGIDAYKLYLEYPVNSTELQKTLATLNRGMVACFAPLHPAINSTLTNNGFSLITLRSTYTLIHKLINPHNSTVTITDSCEQAASFSHELWQPIVTSVAQFSRYFLDTKLGEESAFKLYHQWIENSLNGYADKVFCAVEGNVPLGIITLKNKEDGWYIDLLSVSCLAQGRGIGTALIKTALNSIDDQRQIFVVTETENIPANRFYQQNGFRSSSLQVVYHKHYG